MTLCFARRLHHDTNREWTLYDDEISTDPIPPEGLTRLHDVLAWTRIFDPLGMIDTGFTVPPEKLDRDGNAVFLGSRGSWGFGLSGPATGSSDEPFPCGTGWDGGTGTTWRSDLRREVTAILFTQRHATSPVPPPLIENFWGGVNAATR